MMQKLPGWLRHATGLGTVLLAGASGAAVPGSLGVSVLDRDGNPVGEVAVYAMRISDTAEKASAQRQRAAMVQKDQAFSPHVLIVPAGTEVSFPNEDDVLHHVYSFSAAKQFDITVDSGAAPDAIRFDTPGVVTLGCNIHDNMLAYIVVVDTEHFAKTDSAGMARLENLAPGRYEIGIWTPRLAAKNLPDPITVDVGQGATLSVEHRFDRKLYPAHEHSDTSLHWSYR